MLDIQFVMTPEEEIQYEEYCKAVAEDHLREQASAKGLCETELLSALDAVQEGRYVGFIPHSK